MKIKAQIAMVMNLDKCLGCHTCSITCKNTWTNRSGAEYMYFNNVETKPGIGYPKRWEDQKKWKGGWQLKNGKLQLATGSMPARMLKIFYHPEQPTLDDYYEPWTYDYETLIHSGHKNHQPVARPRSLITQKRMEIKWGPNWEDDLADGAAAAEDPNFQKIAEHILIDYEHIFMRYLPRTCNHCLNPACAAACPSGAIYKREEDGVVVISQETCRGWRHCVPSCPYKKVYYNWKTNKAEKCIFCFPRLESGQAMLCADTCVGRMRYAGVLLYDADRVGAAAETEAATGIYEATLGVILDPHDPAIVQATREANIPEAWIAAAQDSPVYRLIKDWKLALPLHAEYRTMPMVWYIPPMSPILAHAAENVEFPSPEEMRIPLTYLASLFSAGDTSVIERVFSKLLGMRKFMREATLENGGSRPSTRAVASEDAEQYRAMYRLLAVAKYRERFNIPVSTNQSREDKHDCQHCAGFPEMGGV